MLEPTHHPTQAAGAGSEEIHLHDYLTVLLRRRRAFFLGFWGVFLGVILFTFLMKPVYEAAATLHVRDEKVKGGGLLEDLGLSRENPIETEIEILKSRTNAEEVVRRLHLDWSIDKRSQGLEFDLLHFASTAEEPVYRILLTAPQAFELRDEDNHVLGSGRPGETLRAGGVEIHFSRISGKAGEGFRLSLLPFDETVQGVREAIRASEVGKGTNIIRLTYQHNDPSLAREVVNTLAQVYLCTAAVPVISLVVARVVFNESIGKSHAWSTALIVVGIVLYQLAGLTA